MSKFYLKRRWLLDRPLSRAMTSGGSLLCGRLSHLSRHFQGWNGLDPLSQLPLGALQIVALLQIEPEVGTVPTQLSEPQRHHRCYRLLFIKNVIERLTRHAEQFGDFGLWS